LWNNTGRDVTPSLSRGRESVETLRVLVADDEEAVRATLVELLANLSHQVVGEARDGQEAVALARTTNPHVILLDIRMPRLDGLQAARAISEEGPVPIIIVTAHADQELIEEAAEAGVFSYLLKPITQQRLAAAISTARARFADLEILRAEVGDLKGALEARKLVERAKGILMRDLRVGEQEAYRWLKRTSSHHNQKLADVARRIVALEQRHTL
jgi:AmiR/NasT family two-component response regulator